MMQQPSRESSSSSTSSTATAPASPRDDDVDDLRLLLKRRDAELASLQQSLSIEKREHQLTTSKLSRMLQKRGASAGPSDDEVRIRHGRPSPRHASTLPPTPPVHVLQMQRLRATIAVQQRQHLAAEEQRAELQRKLDASEARCACASDRRHPPPLLPGGTLA